jgi:3-oxoadipate enol-lactonase
LLERKKVERVRMIAHLNDLDMFYDIRGSGKPVYLLHGLALDHSIWLEMAEYYADQAQFIIPDLRGHGCTPLGNADGTIEQFASDVLQLADLLGHDQFILAGHSMGGYIALALADAHPERLAGLVTVTSNARADTPEKREGRLDEARRVLTEGTRSVGTDLIQRMMPADEFAQPDEHMCEVIMDSSSEGFANVQSAIARRPNRLAVLSSLTCPVMAIAGGKDQIMPVEVALEAAVHSPKGRTVCLPGVGHMPMIEVPYTLGALLVSM